MLSIHPGLKAPNISSKLEMSFFDSFKTSFQQAYQPSRTIPLFGSVTFEPLISCNRMFFDILLHPHPDLQSTLSTHQKGLHEKNIEDNIKCKQCHNKNPKPVVCPKQASDLRRAFLTGLTRNGDRLW